MKKIGLALGLSSLLVLTACNSENQLEGSNNAESAEDSEQSSTAVEASGENLFNKENVEEGLWIGQGGDIIEKEHMILSEAIPYDPNLSYKMNQTAYVTYLSGEKILKTLLMEEELPIELETVQEADNIKVSFDQVKLDNFELIAE